MKYPHTHRNGALIAFLDIVTMGLFLLFYMVPVEREIYSLTKKKIMPYPLAYLLGLVTFLLVPVFWISFRAEELKEKALAVGLEGKLTSFHHMFIWNLSFKHMFLWNILGCLILVGPLIATYRFFATLNRLEEKENQKA